MEIRLSVHKKIVTYLTTVEGHKIGVDSGQNRYKCGLDLDGQCEEGRSSNESNGRGCFTPRVAKMIKITETECSVVVMVPANQHHGHEIKYKERIKPVATNTF